MYVHGEKNRMVPNALHRRSLPVHYDYYFLLRFFFWAAASEQIMKRRVGKRLTKIVSLVFWFFV